MNQLTTNLQCDECAKGVVKLIVKKYKNGTIDISVKDCNGCRKPFGLKSITTLKEVSNESE